MEQLKTMTDDFLLTAFSQELCKLVSRSELPRFILQVKYIIVLN